jgi:hypothetical protein
MSKRNSNFSIYAHLRMLMRAIPMRNEATLRLAIAARIEADEATGEVYNRGETSPRAHLQDVANVPRATTLDDAMAMLRKLKLVQSRRSYVGGTRRQGGDRLVLDWNQWEDVCLEEAQKQIAQARCTPVSEVQPSTTVSGVLPSTPVSGVQPPTLTGVQPPTLTGVQHNKDTATVTATVTAGGSCDPPRAHGAPSAGRRKRKVADETGDAQAVAEGSSPLPPSEGELQGQQIGVAWAEPDEVPERWPWAFHADTMGKVRFVFNATGRKAYAQLLADGFTPEDILRAQQTCWPRVARSVGEKRIGSASKAGLAMSVFVAACTFSRDQRQRRATSRKAVAIDYAQRDAARVGGRFSDV